MQHRLGTDFDDDELWDKWMALFREHWPHDAGPHVVFSSDAYVVELAERFEACHLVVDADRTTVPISATQIRANPAAHLDRLAPQRSRLGRSHLALIRSPLTPKLCGVPEVSREMVSGWVAW